MQRWFDILLSFNMDTKGGTVQGQVDTGPLQAVEPVLRSLCLPWYGVGELIM